MSERNDLALVAHLMRRAGFGADKAELEMLAAQGYEATVEQLIDPPEEIPAGKTAVLLRYHPIALLPGATTNPGPVQLDVPHDHHQAPPA